MNALPKVFIFLASFLIVSQSYAQTVIYLNEYRVPIQPSKKSPASYFMLKTGAELSQSILTFTMDSVLVSEKAVEKNDQGTDIKKTYSEYAGDGELKSQIEQDLISLITTVSSFYGNGVLKSKKVNKGVAPLEDAYFDQNGQLIPEPNRTAPSPKGEMKGWFEYLATNMTMPVKQAGMDETVIVDFDVNAEGKLENIRVYNPEEVNPALSKEAVRLLVNYPHRWTPGTINGEKVSMAMRIPLRFRWTN